MPSHSDIAPEEYTFDAVRPEDAHHGCIWEYGPNESFTLNQAFFLGVFVTIPAEFTTIPQRMETKFLAALRSGLGPEIFVPYPRVPWVEVVKKLQDKVPEFLNEAIPVKELIYPVKIVKGTEVPHKPGHIVVQMDLDGKKADVIEAIKRIYDEYRPKLTENNLDGRPQDWLARLDWLGMYRLKRAGYTYREIAVLRQRNGAAGDLETIEREVKRGVKNVPKIFKKLFPFLSPEELTTREGQLSAWCSKALEHQAQLRSQ
jgi:hypothetical protein